MKDQSEDFADQLGRYLIRASLTQQELAYKIGMHRNTIVKWVNRTSRPTSRGQVLRVADELSLLKEERKTLIQAAGFSLERWPTEIWTVPQQQDMFFTGRDVVFQSLRELLIPGSTTALTQAISGLGGIGKTHTAVEYAYRFHKDYEAVLWLQAETWESLVSACMKLATELGLPEEEEADRVAEVQHWLRKHRYWLLILDNVENPQEILPKFVPTGHQGYVLVTTRVHNVEPLAQTQVLAAMPEQEGVLFLLRRTKRITAKAELEKASPEQYDEAKQIWQLLDGLPLALDQAGAYILETGCSIPAYQEQYTRRREELLHRRGKRFIGHEASVTTTFSLAFERIEALNLVAADILRACSLLHSEAIPEELFQTGAEHLGPRLATERERWDLALAVLQDYSLVQRNTDTKTLTIHRLVQAVLQSMLEESERHMWAERAMLAVNAAFPDVEYDTWPQCERLLSQALAATQSIEQYQVVSREAGLLCHKAASYLQDRVRYSEAELLFEQALRIREQLVGPEHLDLASPLNNLAIICKQQGKYKKAEPLYLRALQIWEKQLGSDHPQVAYALNNLANLYYEQGRYKEAEPLYLRALHIREQVVGPERPLDVAVSPGNSMERKHLLNVAVSLSNLANLYDEQGRYEEAEPLYRRSLHIREQQREPGHPEIAYPLHNLAILCYKRGKYEEAEPLYLRALQIWEKQLGSDHPLVAGPLNGLANLYYDQGRYGEAEPLFEQARRIWEQQLGPEHLDVASALNNLAGLHCKRGRYEEAEPLYRQALQIWEKQLGSDHPLVAHPLNGLANLYTEQGKYAEAEPLYQRARRIREQQLGLQHPETAESLHDLARFHERQEQPDKALALYQQALAIREKQLGPHHPCTMDTRSRYAHLLRKVGWQDEATLLVAPRSEQAKTEEEREVHSKE